MPKKLTITLNKQVCHGLHSVIGRRRITPFIETVVRPHLLSPDLDAAYRQMAQDELRETGTLAWKVRFASSVRQLSSAMTLFNQHLNRVQVVPFTTGSERFFPSEASVLLNGQVRKAIADQITTVSKRRLSSQLGSLSLTDMERVKQAIKIQLNL